MYKPEEISRVKSFTQWLMVAGFIALLCSCGRNVESAKQAISAASNSAEERKAFLATNTTTTGYTLEFYDAKGTKISPHLTGDYNEVKALKISWPNGSSVTTRVLDTKNLLFLVRE